jgi:hypothetical protein
MSHEDGTEKLLKTEDQERIIFTPSAGKRTRENPSSRKGPRPDQRKAGGSALSFLSKNLLILTFGQNFEGISKAFRRHSELFEFIEKLVFSLL